MPDPVRVHVEAADSIVRDACDGRHVSTYVHGSLALGGYSPLRSDVDVLVVVDDDHRLGVATLRKLGDQLVSLPWPGRGLELSVVTASAASEPTPPWPFLLHVTTAPAKVVVGISHPGDPDLALHYAVVRAAGITVRGRPPDHIIGTIARDVLLRHLADELEWAETQPSETYAVLNAARASCFLHDGSLRSKVDGGQQALANDGPTGLLQRALQVQGGRFVDRSPSAAALRFVRSIRRQLLDATSE